MLLLLTMLAVAQQPPPSAPPPPSATDAPKIGVGFTYDLGLVPSDVTIGWAGQLYVAIGGLVGFSCFGGRAVMIPASDEVILGVESTYCRALSYRVDAATRSAGFFAGVRRELNEGQYASFQLGMGYSGGVIEDVDARWEGMYVRPRGSVSVERGPLAFDFGPFMEIPIFFTQKVEGDDIGPGMMIRLGVEFTVYVGRFGA